jgi:hypothetical protein
MTRDYDAYRRARVVREGCQHNLGCRCEPPYWLRASTPAEEMHEALMKPSQAVELDYEKLRDYAP